MNSSTAKPIARPTPLVLAALIVRAILAFAKNSTSRRRICFIFGLRVRSTINLALARLKARRGALDDSIRYYHNAIYGFWASNPDSNRRQTRFELIEFLSKRNAWPQAQAELLTLSQVLGSDIGVTVGMPALSIAG